MGSQAAWRGVGRQLRGIACQALRAQLCEQHLGKCFTQLFERLGGQLFNKQFDQKIGRGSHQDFRVWRNAKMDRPMVSSGNHTL
ncbi:hypothetical protein D3C81_2234000 [compost metagenome]